MSMDIKEPRYIEYFDSEGKYKSPYVTECFSVYEIVGSIMDNGIPPCKSTKVLNRDFEKVDDALTKKQFEELCIKRINKLFAPKGSISKNTVVHKSDWFRLFEDINKAFYELKRDKSRYDFIIVNGYRCKLVKDVTPDEVIKAYQIRMAERDLAMNFKNRDREVFYKDEFGVKTLFADEYLRHLNALKINLLKEGDKE
jgi:hypothetical protein